MVCVCPRPLGRAVQHGPPPRGASIASAGDIEAAVATLRAHPDSAEVQEKGCEALWTLALASAENKAKPAPRGASRWRWLRLGGLGGAGMPRARGTASCYKRWGRSKPWVRTRPWGRGRPCRERTRTDGPPPHGAGKRGPDGHLPRRLLLTSRLISSAPSSSFSFPPLLPLPLYPPFLLFRHTSVSASVPLNIYTRAGGVPR